MSGVVVMLGCTAVIASSVTQHCVTLSTSEAEYVAMAQGSKTALFTRAVLAFLLPQLVGRIIDLSEDNQGAIAMAENPISGGHTKHIDVRYHFIRELVKHKIIAIKYTESDSWGATPQMSITSPSSIDNSEELSWSGLSRVFSTSERLVSWHQLLKRAQQWAPASG